MAEKTSESARSYWRHNWYLWAITIGWVAFWIWIVTAGGMDAVFSVGIIVFLPVFSISLLLIVWLIAEVISGNHHDAVPILKSLAISIGFPMLLFFYERQHPLALHEAVEWLSSSREDKTEVLAEKVSATGEFKHILWDSSGPSFATTTIYLVFDPSDSLAGAAKSHESGKFAGLPCKVYEVRRLESRWYATVFYLGEDWDQCN